MESGFAESMNKAHSSDSPQPTDQSVAQTPPAKKKFPIIKILLIVVLVSAVGAAGYFVYANFISKSQETVPIPPPEPPIKPTESPTPTPLPTTEEPLNDIQVVDGDIYKVSAFGGNKLLVDKNDFKSDSISGFDKVKVSPDGTKMCFLGYSPMPVLLYYSNIDGSNVTKAYANVANSCVWSPDSKKMAFNNGTSDISPVNILVFDTDTKKVENLTEDAAQEGFMRYYGTPQWSEDSTTITASFGSLGMPDGTQETSGSSTINILTGELVDK